MTIQFKIYAFVNSLTSLVTRTYFLNILTLLLLNQVFYMAFKQKMFDLSDYDYQDRFINVVMRLAQNRKTSINSSFLFDSTQ